MPNSHKLKLAIKKTVAYADIFNYPLTMTEIRKWLVGFKIDSQIKNQYIKAIISRLPQLDFQKGYLFFKGKENLITLRQHKKIYSEGKLKIASEIISWLKRLPFIEFIGITGTLSMHNASIDDDIDLFIITSKHRLWISRFLVTFFVEFTGRRRHPEDHFVSNKICLNMFLSEKYLSVFKKRQNIFIAHEILQIKPLYDKDNTFKKLLTANQWVQKYLPNAWNDFYQKEQIINQKNNDSQAKTKAQLSLNNRIGNYFLEKCELFLKNIQLRYMSKRQTNEKIGEGYIFFHPNNLEKDILKYYKYRLVKMR